MSDMLKVVWGTSEMNALVTVVGGFIVYGLGWALKWSLLAPFQSHIITAGFYFAAIYFLARYFAKGGEYSPALRSSSSVELLLKGKTVVITGASSGIGFEAAREFARLGATVVSLIRGSASRRASVLSSLQAGLPASAARNVSVLEMDISDLDSVRKNAPAVKAAAPKIHLLVNNAGIAMSPFARSAQGLEMQMATNHFGHFLLTQLLMDNLEKANGARVVNVASVAHAFVPKLQYPLYEDEKAYTKEEAYGDSKLANIYFTKVFEEKFGTSKNIHAYALHPGTVRTEIGRHQSPVLLTLMAPLMHAAFKTSPQGARTILHAALSDDAQPGEFHADCKVWKTTAAAKDIESARAFWKKTEEVIANAKTVQQGDKKRE